jgi:hypothetical protein
MPVIPNNIILECDGTSEGVLLDKPTEQEDLIVARGDASCDNVYREQMHKKFNEIGVKVDLTNERAELVDHERLDAVE